MGLFSSSEFDELTLLVEKATSEYIPAAQEDLALNLEITDIIKSKRVTPKDALRLLLTRLTHDNPNVQLLTLQLLDKCVKNGGKHFLVEMAGREFVDVAVSMMDDNEYGHDCNHLVQERLIELFQEWALIFQSDPSLAYLYDTYTALKTQKRVFFPQPAKTLDQVDPLSIVSSLAPPEWSDSPACQRCRDAFTLTNRKHHCRKCGGTFCQLCSSNEMTLLEMGITEPVRVCDSCYKKDDKRKEDKDKRRGIIYDEPLPKQPTDEDEDLKKAIELSLKDQKQQATNENAEKEFDENALKKAIEASIKESGQQNHMSLNNSSNIGNTSNTHTPTNTQTNTNTHSNTLHFNDVELENISMFHQLIGRLIRTRPTLTPEDATDLKKLAAEMRKLSKRPIEDENVKGKLEEAIKGYELLFEHSQQQQETQVTSPPLSITNNSESSKDLNQMKAEMLGDNPGGYLGAVRTRLGSLSLENTGNPQVNGNSIGQSVSNPVPLPAAFSHNNFISPPPPAQIQQTLHPSSHTHIGPISSTPHQFHPYPHPHAHAHVNMPPALMQMCPEMTIHPHPIHPFTHHENPYAIKNNNEPEAKDEKKKKRKKKEKKDKKRKRSEKDKKHEKSKDRDEKSKDKDEKSKDERSKTESNNKSKTESKNKSKTKNKNEHEHKSKDKDKHEHKSKDSNSKSGDTRMKKKSKKEATELSNDPNTLVDESGRKSPINLIDL